MFLHRNASASSSLSSSRLHFPSSPARHLLGELGGISSSIELNFSAHFQHPRSALAPPGEEYFIEIEGQDYRADYDAGMARSLRPMLVFRKSLF